MFSIIFALALAASPPAEGEAQAHDQHSAGETTQDKRICRSIRIDMGSRRKERVCLTKEQWREFNRGN